MKLFNIINDNTIEIEKLPIGELYTEKNMYGEVVNKFLLHPPESESSTIPLHLKMGKFKSIYLPLINYTAKESPFRDEVTDLNVDELVMDIKLIPKHILNNENLILLADESVSGLYADTLMGRKGKFKKVILYCKGKVNWNDIIYDWKDLTDNLRIIIGENQLYQSNLATPYEKLENLRPPHSLKENFNVELEIQVENDGEIDMGFGLGFETTLGNVETNRLINANWKDVVSGLRTFTPNIYYCNLNQTNLVTNYNSFDPFNPNQPVVIITHKEVNNYRRKKDMEIRYLDLNFEPTVDILFRSIDYYKKAYEEIYMKEERK